MSLIDLNEGKGGVGFRVREIWLALAVHEDGDEGVVAVLAPTGWAPLVAADPKRLEFVREAAKELAKERGKPIRIVRLSQRSDVEVFHPDGRHENLGS
jgi:hypothetical protein